MTTATNKKRGTQERITCKDTGLKYEGRIIWEDVETGEWYDRNAGSQVTRAFGRRPYVFRGPLNKEFIQEMLNK